MVDYGLQTSVWSPNLATGANIFYTLPNCQHLSSESKSYVSTHSGHFCPSVGRQRQCSCQENLGLQANDSGCAWSGLQLHLQQTRLTDKRSPINPWKTINELLNSGKTKWRSLSRLPNGACRLCLRKLVHVPNIQSANGCMPTESDMVSKF